MSTTVSLGAPSASRYDLADPRWDSLMTEARTRFGIQALRPGQRELITGVLAGRDSLGILPTGGGKSLTYQLPSLVLPKLVAVVSRTLALMKDQREHLEAAGIRVIELDSTIGAREERAGEAAIREGAHRVCHAGASAERGVGRPHARGDEPILGMEGSQSPSRKSRTIRASTARPRMRRGAGISSGSASRRRSMRTAE